MPDFRAAEARVPDVGPGSEVRAGRKDRPGHRAHPNARSPITRRCRSRRGTTFAGFIEHELADRAELGYPPYAPGSLSSGWMVPDEGKTHRIAHEIFDLARRDRPRPARANLRVLGPAAAPLARLRGRYRFQVLLRARASGVVA